MKKTTLPLTLVSLAALALGACAGSYGGGSQAEARLEARSGSQVAGTVRFSQAPGGKLHVEAQLSGLTPGAHGFHIHEAGDCSAPDASSAKGHFNPGGHPHGHHAGDMPNLVADAGGNARFSGDLDMLSLAAGAGGILDRSVVVHADPDDYQSQPAGNSGKRVACGTIRAAVH